MESDNTINLIKTTVSSSPKLEESALFVKKVSMWGLLVLLGAGLAVSSVYYFLLTRREQLASTKQVLSTEIAQNAVKEELLLSLKQRILLTNKVMAAQLPLSKTINTVTSFVPSGQMSALSIDDNKNVIVTIRANSLADAISTTDAFVKQVAARTIRTPKLDEISMGLDGSINVTLSFLAVF